MLNAANVPTGIVGVENGVDVKDGVSVNSINSAIGTFVFMEDGLFWGLGVFMNFFIVDGDCVEFIGGFEVELHAIKMLVEKRRMVRNTLTLRMRFSF